jgi:hypothetical protein
MKGERVVALDLTGVELAALYVKGGAERGGAVADVVELSSIGTSEAHRLGGVLAALGLGAGLFVHGEHDGVFWGQKV